MGRCFGPCAMVSAAGLCTTVHRFNHNCSSTIALWDPDRSSVASRTTVMDTTSVQRLLTFAGAHVSTSKSLSTAKRTTSTRTKMAKRAKNCYDSHSHGFERFGYTSTVAYRDIVSFTSRTDRSSGCLQPREALKIHRLWHFLRRAVSCSPRIARPAYIVPADPEILLEHGEIYTGPSRGADHDPPAPAPALTSTLQHASRNITLGHSGVMCRHRHSSDCTSGW